LHGQDQRRCVQRLCSRRGALPWGERLQAWRRVRRGGGDWEITFRFAASPNQTGLSVGSITGINKKGWEYLWVRYADAEDTGSGAIIKKPIAAYVERVYDDANFGALGI
jgi:hypothetical protein